MNVTETCCCGSQITLSDRNMFSVAHRLDEFREAHGVCRNRRAVCPSCGDNGDCGETAAECGNEFHGQGEH